MLIKPYLVTSDNYYSTASDRIDADGEAYRLKAFEELFSKEEPQPKTSHAFIVRVWSEAAGEANQATSWRGSIQSVGSDNRLYFYDLRSIQRFIEESLEINSRQPRSWWQTLLHKLHLYD